MKHINGQIASFMATCSQGGIVEKPLIGFHASITGGLYKAVERAAGLGATTFQIFTRNPRGWRYKPLKKEEVESFRKKAEENDYKVTMAHMPYLPNIASPIKGSFKKSVNSLIAELSRCGELGIPYLVAHIGSHMGRGIDVGISKVVESCSIALSKVENDVMLLLENMAGTKNSVGSTFDNIRRIIDGIDYEDRIGICLDTCHLFAAGYDLRDKATVEKTLEEFDNVVGLKLLKAIHVNDSKGGLGSGKDRHEHIGMGYIGDKGFKAILSHKAVRSLPLVLETPEDERGDFDTNIKKLKRLYMLASKDK